MRPPLYIIWKSYLIIFDIPGYCFDTIAYILYVKKLYDSYMFISYRSCVGLSKNGGIRQRVA